jgi:ubiquitin carboxyl-terminal hydrolase 8
MEQNDINEFLSVFIDKLNEELRIPLPQPKQFKPSSLFESLQVKMSQDWYDNNKNDYSLIKELMFGQQISQIICGHCSKIHHNYEMYMNIMLGIEGKESLSMALNHHFDDEQVDSEWVCDNCRFKSSSQKSIKLWKNPKLLVLSVKRFTPDLRKINEIIDIPEYIDIEEHTIGKTYTKYRLVSVSCHHGSIDSGHYISVCKVNDHWFAYDDEQVFKIDNYKEAIKRGYTFLYEGLQPDL